MLGLLSESEAREVEQVVAAYPEIKSELNAMEDALTQYAVAKGIPMPADLPGRIIRRLETLDKDVPPGSTTPPQTDSGSGPILPILGFLLITALAGAIYFWFQTDELQENLNTTQTELQQLQVNCDQIQDSLEQIVLSLAVLRSEGNQTFIMRGLPDKNPGAVANVYYNTQAQQAFLDIRELPPPPAGQQYQLWGIGASGVPQSMDVFNIPQGDGINFIPVPYLADVSVFAVSLEPAGGSPSPTDVHMISG
ncbi:anti-sigma factor [Flavilitoribacter nigricans]|uniref:Anti-sigma K factor RskA C-terminal domain-containing protein n=1 Tax=Flavilitoribacter nigricans (strain ATCC 23147 / DSM 23189 / NBRC 102662 / NCIMB 1420 / SS-2) TaxID=1122177 RepID=A0A2D0NIU8_FLAN2|nr:anti-sigma factor [Flavilitoribacter nigricans]PHN08368.1 hypothetical protein CRP01_00200 [Flavilitoribacter nigricans DSM 23189 = NBRC 102662]